jgi:hypothetical protein
MKKQRLSTIVIAGFISTCAIAGLVYGQENQEAEKKFSGFYRLRFDNFFVDEDGGRFREDNLRKDDASGGLDWLHLESTEPDEKGYEWLLEGKALYDYDYDFHFLLKKEDSHYFKLDFSSLRYYYDGSNEYWDQSFYMLPSAGGRLANEISDGGFFTDRRDYNIEFGITPPEGLELILGWHRSVKDGKEVLLLGSQATIGFVPPDFYGIPAVKNFKGITDTFYGEIARTFNEKYNFRIRQEFEQYHDDQLTLFPRSVSGTLNDQRFKDDPGYTNWRTMLMFDSFLDEETYVTANYMYNYLNNDSTRTSTGASGLTWLGLPMSDFTDNRVGSSRRTNVGALGYKRANIMPDLHLTAALRLEDSRTKSRSSGMLGAAFQDFTSHKDEFRVGETVRLVYKGIKKTTLSFDADLEQRDLGWKENNNGQRWNADVDFTDQVYSVKAVHRFNSKLKSTFKFRIKDLERSYTNLFDSDSASYPGFLGNYRRKGNDVTLKTDWRLNGTTSATLMYQFVQESIDTELGGKTQNLEIHRGSGSLSMNPLSNLFLVTTFMLENYQRDTPASGNPGSKFAFGPRPFDFVGDSFSILLDGTYILNDKDSCTFAYQHTESLGKGDGNNTNDSAYDKIVLMMKHKIAKNQAFSAGYQFINFDNHNGTSFDDYSAHGVLFTYEFVF